MYKIFCPINNCGKATLQTGFAFHLSANQIKVAKLPLQARFKCSTSMHRKSIKKGGVGWIFFMHIKNIYQKLLSFHILIYSIIMIGCMLTYWVDVCIDDFSIN